MAEFTNHIKSRHLDDCRIESTRLKRLCHERFWIRRDLEISRLLELQLRNKSHRTIAAVSLCSDRSKSCSRTHIWPFFVETRTWGRFQSNWLIFLFHNSVGNLNRRIFLREAAFPRPILVFNIKMKTFKIEPIPAEEQSQTESVYYVTVDGDPVICLSDSEANSVLSLNYSQQQGHLFRTLDSERLMRRRKALGAD